MAKSPSVLIAKQGFVGEYNGERLNVAEGDLIESHHPLVKQNPHLFGPAVFRFPAPGQRKAPDKPKAEAKKEPAKKVEEPTGGHPMRVEQATKSPGEKR